MKKQLLIIYLTACFVEFRTSHQNKAQDAIVDEFLQWS
jgi:hypothetical protein